MHKYLSHRLFWRFFFSYFAVVLLSLIVLGVIMRLLLPDVYDSHLFRMAALFSQNGMEGGMPMMHSSGMMTGDPQFFQSLFEIFNRIIFESVLYAMLPSLVVTLTVSALMSGYFVKPLRAMAETADQIAAGEYQRRLPTNQASPDRQDELDQLATRFNRMAMELEKIEERRKRLIGDVAHELRTPLTVIKGSMEGLLDGVLEPEEKTFLIVYRQADRLERLVDDLQELHFLEAGELQLDLHSINLVSFLENVIQMMENKFKEANVRLIFSPSEENIQVLGDADRLAQVMINLLSNALRYTPSGGKVEVLAEIDPVIKVAKISVSDSGVGIQEEHLQNIFERFYRIDGARSRQDGGSGIGLTITKNLVEAHQGRIWVESQGVGEGAIFRFTIPLIDDQI